MGKLVRARPSPAMIVAMTALVISLSGTTIAAVGGPSYAGSAAKAKHGKKKPPSESAADQKQILADAPKLSVKFAASASTATNATNATNATKASNATNATNATKATDASQLGGQPASSYEGKAEWALIATDGSVVQQSGGISAVETKPGFGTYKVTFPNDISGKSLSVSLSDKDAAFGGSPIVSPCAGPGEVGGSLCGTSQGNKDVAFVDTPDAKNEAPLAHAFYIQAIP